MDGPLAERLTDTHGALQLAGNLAGFDDSITAATTSAIRPRMSSHSTALITRPSTINTAVMTPMVISNARMAWSPLSTFALERHRPSTILLPAYADREQVSRTRL